MYTNDGVIRNIILPSCGGRSQSGLKIGLVIDDVIVTRSSKSGFSESEVLVSTPERYMTPNDEISIIRLKVLGIPSYPVLQSYDKS